MFKKIKNKDSLDIEKVNDTVELVNHILKIAYILIIIVAAFLVIRVVQVLNLTQVMISVLKILAPLFIGLFLAWLFEPIVRKLNKAGIRRSLGTIIVYLVFLGLLALLICSIIPVLSDQINDFVSSLPSIFESIKNWITDLFGKLNKIDGFNANSIKDSLFIKVEKYGQELTTAIPEITVNTIRTFASGLGVFLVGLIIGFYLLIGFGNAGELLITLIPKKYQKEAKTLALEVNSSLRRFVNGALLDAMFVFIIISIAFAIIGLRAPLLFGLFCGITNVIPYAGPYIGGIPAVIVGFSQGTLTGIFTLIAVVIIQFLEGNFLQPVIMSKTTKLHPVTIIVGLLIFGHFFGIVGMVISTPIIAIIKSLLMFTLTKMGFDFESIQEEK